MSGLEAYQPGAASPWDRAAVGHLLRRAGFCPSEAEVRAALAAGPSATVDALLADGAESPRHIELEALGDRLAQREDVAGLRQWWLLRMAATKHPLRARLAVFWHNHFATSNAKVRSPRLMAQQLRTLEKHALGGFGDLLAAMARDPAMIVWLDGAENIKGRPNENFARELFELFALGVGNYSESDIREAARSFTGWQQRDGRFHFAHSDHDDGEKTVFGRRGRFHGEDVLRLTLEHPACARFLALKLLREFLCPQPPAALIGAVAQRLQETNFQIGETLRALLSSAAFFDPQWRRVRIKSPVEYAIGIVRSLEMRAPGAALAEAVSQMGQRLLEPPSVKGWDGHRNWINEATLLVRMNAADHATRGDGKLGLAPQRLIEAYELRDADAVRAYCADVTLDGQLPSGLQRELKRIRAEGESLLRASLRLLLCSPEYHMA